MQRWKHIGIVLGLSLPYGLLFGGVSGILWKYYDKLYAIHLGPWLMLTAVILGIFCLVAPVQIHRANRKYGWRKARELHVYAPLGMFFRYVPLVILLLWLWFLTAYRGLTAISNGTLSDQLVFLLAGLMLVAEIVESFRRKDKLKQYFDSREQGTWELEPLHWSDRTLGIMVYGEGVMYLVLIWSVLILLVGLAETALNEVLRVEVRSWINLGIMLGVLLGGRRLEKWWDRYARKQFWVPW